LIRAAAILFAVLAALATIAYPLFGMGLSAIALLYFALRERVAETMSASSGDSDA
jgi:hypothetical protein